MKNIIDDLVEAVTLINQISEYDYEGMGTIICMLIDVAGAKHHKPVGEVLENVCQMVKEVNAELGAYHYIKEG